MSDAMKTKSIRLTDVEMKVDSAFPGGTIEGLAAHGGNVDQQGERIMPGAFRKTIETFRKSKRILPLLDNHRVMDGTDAVIGRVIELEERKNGSLFFKAFFSGVEAAQAVRQKIKEKVLDSLSIGFHLKDKRTRADRVVELLEIQLREISVTPFPANELATVTGVKSDDGTTSGKASPPVREPIDEADFNDQVAARAAERKDQAEADKRYEYEHQYEKW